MIVDDNVDMANLMGALVQHCGHESRVVNDAVRSLVVASEFKPSIALLDIGLPGMNGFELARQLRLVPGLEAIKLVALTGYSDEDHRRRATEAGFDVHLVKPIALAQLQSVLNDDRTA